MGRYLVMVDIATMCVSLGVLGILGSSKSMRRHATLVDLLILGAGLGASLPRLWNGARLDAVLAFVAVLVVAAYFGFGVRRVTLLIMSVLIGAIILWITVVRGNSSVAEDPMVVIQQLLSGDLTSDYASQVGSIAGPVLAFDRVGGLALVLEYLDLTGDYLSGESLLSGPVGIVMDLRSRLPGSQQVPAMVFRQANEVTFYWRFGRSGLGSAVPPSLPGEFYMQFGVAGVLVFSILFGLFISWFRRRIASSQSLIRRWTLAMTLILLVKATSAEASVFFSAFLFTLMPIPVTYAVVITMLRPGGRRSHVARR